MSKALDHGLTALELLAQGPQTAADIAHHLSVDRTTGWRILRVLAARGWALEDPHVKAFTLNVTHLYELAGNGHEHIALPSVIMPVLERIRDRLGESAVLGVPSGSSMVYLQYAASAHAVGVREAVGSVRPMHASALGKAYLSALDSDDLEKALGNVNLQGGTARAVSSLAALREAVAVIRCASYAVDLEECFDGVICVGLPAYIGHDHLLIGAVAVSGPRERMLHLGLDRVAVTIREELDLLERYRR